MMTHANKRRHDGKPDAAKLTFGGHFPEGNRNRFTTSKPQTGQRHMKLMTQIQIQKHGISNNNPEASSKQVSTKKCKWRLRQRGSQVSVTNAERYDSLGSE